MSRPRKCSKMQRRTFVRRPVQRSFARPRKKWMWVRETFNNIGPQQAPIPNMGDLLATFKTQMGINFNLPDIVIWRLLIKIAVKISFVPAVATASSGVLISAFVDDEKKANSLATTSFNPLSSPFDEKYLSWEMLYAAQSYAQGGQIPTALTDVFLYKELDIRAHRKISNLNETLWFTLSASGDANILQYSYTYSLLLKLP